MTAFQPGPGDRILADKRAIRERRKVIVVIALTLCVISAIIIFFVAKVVTDNLEVDRACESAGSRVVMYGQGAEMAKKAVAECHNFWRRNGY